MKDVDFTSCPFINEVLCFLTYFDFCKNAKIIKAYYDALENDAKRFYKWYLYANIHMNEFFKDSIWQYLNSNDPIDYINLMDNQKKYKVR